MGAKFIKMASSESEPNPLAKKKIEAVESTENPDDDPTGPCCGICDPPTKFEEREVIRISNRNVLEIQAEIKVTLKKLGMFLVWFYVSLYTCVLVMQAAMGVTIKANAPFDSATFDWTEDEGIAAGVGTILGYLFTIPGVVLIIKEGGSREYEKVWDFVASLGGLHLILTCIVDLEFPTEGMWWATEVVGLLILWTVGWYMCTRYWHMKGLERLVGKVGRMNITEKEPKFSEP